MILFVAYGALVALLLLLLRHVYRHLQIVKKLQHIPGRVYPFYFWYSMFTKDDWAFHTEEHIQRNLQFATPSNVEGDSSRKGFWKVIAGTEAYLHTCDVELYKQIFVTQVKKFKKFTPLKWLETKYHLHGVPHIAFEDTNEKWRKKRNFLNPAFADNSLAFSFDTDFNTLTDRLANVVEEQTKDSTTFQTGIDCKKLLHYFTFDVITKVGFGADYHCLDEHYLDKPVKQTAKNVVEELRFIFDTAKIRIVVPFGVATLLSKFVPYFSKIMEALTFWRSNILGLIRDRKQDLEESKGNTDILTKLLSLEKINPDEALTLEELVANSHGFLAAGQETSANALGFSLHILASYPEYQERIRQEIIEALGSLQEEKITCAVFENNFKFLKSFIKEVLRMRGPAHLNIRSTAEDMMLKSNGQDIFVPKGVVIVTWYSITHQDENIWGKDAKQFRPDRFMEDKVYGVEYSPFCYASRSCIGKRFAEMEISLAILKLVQRFRISLPPNDQMKTFEVPKDYAFTCGISRCKLVFEKIQY